MPDYTTGGGAEPQPMGDVQDVSTTPMFQSQTPGSLLDVQIEVPASSGDEQIYFAKVWEAEGQVAPSSYDGWTPPANTDPQYTSVNFAGKDGLNISYTPANATSYPPPNTYSWVYYTVVYKNTRNGPVEVLTARDIFDYDTSTHEPRAYAG